MNAIIHHKAEFNKQHKLIESHGDNAYILWALGLYLDEPDLDALSSRALTDGGNDKSIDFLEIDKTGQKIVIVQGYYTKKNGDKAPSKKASDINTAVAWLASGDMKCQTINQRLKERISDCRDLIEQDEIEHIELIYIHNLPESINTKQELETCERNAQKLFLDKGISVTCKELGITEIESLYMERSSQILIKHKIKIDGERIGYIQNTDWDAYIFNIKGEWLRDLFKQHDDKLFSANYRGFLGVNKRKKINSGIKNTAEKQAPDFWVFNNGITLITTQITEEKAGRKKENYLHGISIINGAQTTGSLGSIDSNIGIPDVKVMCRVVVCKNPEKIEEIVKYNNTQNKITTWDQYANDETQKNLKDQFKKLGFEYSLKRGFDAATAEIGIEKVAQPVLAFNGSLQDSNRSKNSIFESAEIYKRAFYDKSARHVLLAFCFSRSIDNIKNTLQNKETRTKMETEQLNLFNHFSFKNFLQASIGRCLEPFIKRQYNINDLKVNNNSIKTIEEMSKTLEPITRQVLRGVTRELGSYAENNKASMSDILKKEETLVAISPDVNSFLEGIIDGRDEYDFSNIIYSPAC
ncbi:AIPR family protein [Chitinilyticum litopenaei]|uniref:AIPR family protein n=1 Tax=Chitinilyticum litopenaei TaxID=1121276 RepID=UPI000414A9FF|nr:AIPR family protein [Chitinilyticum litopenaei]